MEHLLNYLLIQAPWKIIAWGAAALVVTFAIITGLAMLAYAFLPVWLAVVLHIGAMVAAGYYVPKPFLAAYLIRRWLMVVNAQMSRNDG